MGHSFRVYNKLYTNLRVCSIVINTVLYRLIFIIPVSELVVSHLLPVFLKKKKKKEILLPRVLKEVADVCGVW